MILLEPISKSPEEDDEASELDEAEEVLRVIFPAHKYAALPLDPGEEAFYQPASGVSSKSRGRLASGVCCGLSGAAQSSRCCGGAVAHPVDRCRKRDRR